MSVKWHKKRSQAPQPAQKHAEHVATPGRSIKKRPNPGRWRRRAKVYRRAIAKKAVYLQGIAIFGLITEGIVHRRGWLWGTMILVSLQLATVVDILDAHLRWQPLKLAKPWFEESFPPPYKEQLVSNYQRMFGTLTFWKNRARLFEKISKYSILWSIVAGILVAALIQDYDKNNEHEKLFLTLLLVWSTIATAVSRSFKAEELYRGFRQTESDYYDVSRRLIDRRSSAENMREQIDAYFKTVEQIRKAARDAETSNQPKVDV